MVVGIRKGLSKVLKCIYSATKIFGRTNYWAFWGANFGTNYKVFVDDSQSVWAKQCKFYFKSLTILTNLGIVLADDLSKALLAKWRANVLEFMYGTSNLKYLEIYFVQDTFKNLDTVRAIHHILDSIEVKGIVRARCIPNP